MADKWWCEIQFQAGKMASDTEKGPVGVDFPKRWYGLSDEQFLAIERILHEAQGKLLDVTEMRAKGKK